MYSRVARHSHTLQSVPLACPVPRSHHVTDGIHVLTESTRRHHLCASVPLLVLRTEKLLGPGLISCGFGWQGRCSPYTVTVLTGLVRHSPGGVCRVGIMQANAPSHLQCRGIPYFAMGCFLEGVSRSERSLVAAVVQHPQSRRGRE
ncbi:hypothetical protein HJG60_008314 [Phyllostomus discolor]|uniref:Uncharacterized protein n=1 Tax=Phyllostomus discolor TaxID=89673 RepID=A0A833ZB57_9CHIR|nr:hypothetical protein HJG60_008314 [Phyllostomus discolor]